jgi:lactoylglutathione lyase
MRAPVSFALAACLITAWAAPGPWSLAAQSPVTWPFDHVHLAVTEPERAAEWYVRRLGGRPAATADRVWFGDVLVIFQKTAERRPVGPGAVGHIAFASPDVPATVAALVQDGARALAKTADAGPSKAGMAEDPWGVPIEIVEGAGPGLHHAHVMAVDPSETLNGYARLFGGIRTRVGQSDGLQYGSVFLLAEHGDAVSMPTAIDHISWRVQNVEEATATLRAAGVKVLREPGMSPGGNQVSFVEGPGGVRIEVMQRSR